MDNPVKSRTLAEFIARNECSKTILRMEGYG